MARAASVGNAWTWWSSLNPPSVAKEGDGRSQAGARVHFYGRRKGKRLRPGQEERLTDLLPRLRLPEGAIVEWTPRVYYEVCVHPKLYE